MVKAVVKRRVTSARQVGMLVATPRKNVAKTSGDPDLFDDLTAAVRSFSRKPMVLVGVAIAVSAIFLTRVQADTIKGGPVYDILNRIPPARRLLSHPKLVLGSLAMIPAVMAAPKSDRMHVLLLAILLVVLIPLRVYGEYLVIAAVIVLYFLVRGGTTKVVLVVTGGVAYAYQYLS
nr:TPA_asm: hypothetical protein [Provittati virus]